MNEFISLDEKFNEIKDLINISIELGEEEELESQHISLINIDEELVNEVGKSFKNIYWLNPERLKYWNTGDSLIRKFDRVTNNTSEVRNYNQMKAFVNSIDFKRDLK